MGRSGNKNSEKTLSPGMEKAASKIASGILWLQIKWATWMNRLFANMPNRYRWLTLITCSILMVLVSGGLIINGIRGEGQRLSISANPSPVSKALKPAIQPQEPYQKLPAPIKVFRQIIDSLSRTEEGKRKLDSFFRARPGLRDSLKEIESIYKQHKD